ncbi:hypothetical protein [Micromonospora taraxaci]|uniref:hypothetical protein n=1 Tax=Micromonospora taraxaci TaxID=1316803 RepID=UPI0033A32912
MTHPHRLHATAAALSLGAARGRLTRNAEAEAAQIAAEALEAPSVLRSTVYGGRHASGGHSDPTATAYLVADRPFRVNQWQALADDITAHLANLAQHLPAAGRDPLDRIRAAIPAMRPEIAHATTTALVHLDEIARRKLRTGPDRSPLRGVACPHCGERQLMVQTAGPIDAWTVVCATGRLCAGTGCGCGMPGAVEGVAHIWWRADVIGAVAGAAPTHTE